MAISIATDSGKDYAGVNYYICDTLADANDLPVSPECRPGSTAIIISEGSVAMLGNDNVWHMI